MNKEFYKIRDFNNSDYNTVANWLYSWGIKEWDSDVLPETSYIVEYKEKPILFGSFYKTNSKSLGLMENFVGDREMKKERRLAVKILIEHIENEAKKCGCKALLGYLSEEKLKPIYAEFGFSVSSKNFWSIAKAI